MSKPIFTTLNGKKVAIEVSEKDGLSDAKILPAYSKYCYETNACCACKDDKTGKTCLNIIEKLDVVLDEYEEDAALDKYEEYEEDDKDKWDGVGVLKKMFQDGDYKEFIHLDDETKRIMIIMGWRKYTHKVGDIIIRQYIVNGNLYCSKDTIAKVNPKSYITRSGTNLIKQSYYVIDEVMTRHLHLKPVEIN